MTLRSPLFAIGLALMLLLQAVATAASQATPASDDTPGWWQGAACYEIFVRSFADSDGDGIGDFQGIIDHLDHLNDGTPGSGDDLGITCIWLMPVMQSPTYHGYDVTDYYTVEEDYGTNDDFLRLIDEAHARNIRVIIDFPINHTSSEHPWFIDAASNPDSPYRDWYIFEKEDPGYIGPWGQQVWHPSSNEHYYGIFDASMPDLNFTNPDVNEEVRAIAEFWLTDMRVDGFRLDAIKHVIEDGPIQENTPETIDWIRDFSAFVREVNPDAFTIGEVMGGGNDNLQVYYPDTLDAYFHFDLAQNMVNSANFGSARQLTAILNGAADRLPNQRWGTFLTNHDQPRIATQVGENPEKLRLGPMMLFTFPGTPFIYYGEEIGMPGSKPDPNIRTPMQWSGEPGGGFTTGTPYTAMQPGWEDLNVAAQEGDPTSVLETYRAWGQLHETHTALQVGDYIPVDSGSVNVLAFIRQDESETLLVVINLGGKETEGLQVSLPDGISGTTTDLFINEPGPDAQDGTLTLPPMPGRSGTVYEVGE